MNNLGKQISNKLFDHLEDTMDLMDEDMLTKVSNALWTHLYSELWRHVLGLLDEQLYRCMTEEISSGPE